jgi:thiamine-phosphate pyrophosphorylase
VSGRPDLARLADADGVYLKPGDLPVAEARRVLGASGVVGCSALSVDEARAAERDGATYVVYGPVFTSPEDGADGGGGLDLVREMTAPDSQPGIPCFAFGGITAGNLDEVIEAGARRVAVSAAVIGSDDPARVAREFREKLDTAGNT